MNPNTTPSSSSTSGSSSWFSGIVGGRKSNNTSTSSTMANKSTISSIGPTLGGPINRKNQFRGVMFKYGPKSIQVIQSPMFLFFIFMDLPTSTSFNL